MRGNPLFNRPWRRRLAIALALLIVAFLLVTGALFWRLSRGPVSLELLRPRIESALNELASPLSVELGTPSLSWSGWPRPVDLTVRDTRVKNPAGDEVLSFAEVGIVVSQPALLRGKIEPVGAQLLGTRVAVRRSPDVGRARCASEGSSDR